MCPRTSSRHTPGHKNSKFFTKNQSEKNSQLADDGVGVTFLLTFLLEDKINQVCPLGGFLLLL